MERDFRIQATLLRKTMADIAGRQRVSWSFKVVRGGVTQELLNAGSSAHMVSLGRVGTTPGKRVGSTAQAVVRNTQRPVIVQTAQQALVGPFSVVYLGDESSEHAVSLAIQLAKSHSTKVSVLMLNQPKEKSDALAQEFALSGVESDIYSMQSMEPMSFVLHNLGQGTVILPVQVASWLDDIMVAVIVVP